MGGGSKCCRERAAWRRARLRVELKSKTPVVIPHHQVSSPISCNYSSSLTQMSCCQSFLELRGQLTPPKSDLISMAISLKLITQRLTCAPRLPTMWWLRNCSSKWNWGAKQTQRDSGLDLFNAKDCVAQGNSSRLLHNPRWVSPETPQAAPEMK